MLSKTNKTNSLNKQKLTRASWIKKHKYNYIIACSLKITFSRTLFLLYLWAVIDMSSFHWGTKMSLTPLPTVAKVTHSDDRWRANAWRNTRQLHAWRQLNGRARYFIADTSVVYVWTTFSSVCPALHRPRGESVVWQPGNQVYGPTSNALRHQRWIISLNRTFSKRDYYLVLRWGCWVRVIADNSIILTFAP